jgi:outer membrane translocation and assembly module TamA
MGADRDYRRLWGAAEVARGLASRTTVEARAFVGWTVGQAPAYDHFRIGGPDLLPGRQIDELWGPAAAAASLAVRVRVLAQLRAVARVGAGQVFPSRNALRLTDLPVGGGLGLVYPTRLGPLRLDVGVREGGDTLVTFAVSTH